MMIVGVADSCHPKEDYAQSMVVVGVGGHCCSYSKYWWWLSFKH